MRPVDAQDPLDRAAAAYEQAVFGGDGTAVADGAAHLDLLEAGLALARGRLAHARFLGSSRTDTYDRGLFDRAVDLYRAHGDVRGEAEATFWLATYHQVVLGDHDTAEPLLRRADDLATKAGDDLTRSYALRHLCFVAQHHDQP